MMARCAGSSWSTGASSRHGPANRHSPVGRDVGERIVAVGGDAAVRAMAPPDAQTLDIEGDWSCRASSTHDHLAFTGAELASVDVRYPGVASIADLVGRIAEAAERTPDGT